MAGQKLALCRFSSDSSGGTSNHDDAISSHVYETKGFLSEPTTSATPTHTVTLGVIYSKTSRCMQMRSTLVITIINTRKKLIKKLQKQKWHVVHLNRVRPNICSLKYSLISFLRSYTIHHFTFYFVRSLFTKKDVHYFHSQPSSVTFVHYLRKSLNI